MLKVDNSDIHYDTTGDIDTLRRILNSVFRKHHVNLKAVIVNTPLEEKNEVYDVNTKGVS